VITADSHSLCGARPETRAVNLLTQGLPPIWLIRSSCERPCCMHHAKT
jgi:hypothetical protein